MNRLLLVACGMAFCCSAQAARPEAAPYRGAVKVTFLGDVMCQGPMLKAYSTGDGKYDFSEVFAGVKGLLAESDYVFANLETPIAPDNQDLTHERYSFCSPHEFAEAAKAAGIDFVFTANNHCLDRGSAGIPRTVAALDKIGLPHTGTFATAQDAAKPLVVDVKGFRIGVLSYTYGSNAFANHQYLSETNRFMVNLFQEQELSNPLARAWMRNRNSEEGRRYAEYEKKNRPENLTLPVYERQEPHERERQELAADVARMKAAKPDFIAMSMHAGGQYNPVATKYTKELAEFIRGCGVDWISGTHEHVVHGGDFSKFGESRLTTYSLGNFNSLNGVWQGPYDKMADYSIAWHLYLDRKGDGTPFVAKTTFSVLKTIRCGDDNRIRVVPVADHYIRQTDHATRQKLRADLITVAKRFCGTDFDQLGVCAEYPIAAARPEAAPYQAGFTVDKDMPAGNIELDRIDGNMVYLHQELRDTTGEWFYWAFRVKGAQGRTLKFSFTNKKSGGGPVGVRGPVVSTDGGKTFSYPLDGKSRPDGFTYAFGPNDAEVLFYECHPYVRANWDAFVKRHADALGKRFVVETLCKSRKGADVPCVRFGCIGDEPKYRIFMSARHHCSETMASWVLEGAGEAFLAEDDLGRWLRANVELMMVPFTDYDGAQAGDQGKNRGPHDHNRDYVEFLYPETKAITEWIGRHAGGKLDIFLDVHCPWIRGKYNEWLYTPWKNPQFIPDIQAEHRYSQLLEALQCGSMRYRAADDLPFGVAWNKGTNYKQGWSSVIWACQKVKGLKVARTYEVPFANANGAVVTPETCRELGHDTAKVFRAFLGGGDGASGGRALPCVSGVYPHLAMYNDEGECGTGAVVPWAEDLWVVTYGPHCPLGSSDKLYRIKPDLTRETFAGSVGGTHANRMIHRETNQLLIGPYVIDAKGDVRVIPPLKMPGRLTANARHLKEPGRKAYYATMEAGLFEVDLQTLDVNTLIQDDGINKALFAKTFKAGNAPKGWYAAPVPKLPGYHGKGMMNGFGKLFYANNGEQSSEARRNPFIPSGALGSWSAPGEDWKLVRRCQFTEVTSPDGIYGNEHPDTNPVWTLGWDAKSVILDVTTNGAEWTYYRLPKASHCYDGAHGWNTEWPRIRDVGFEDGTLLATMHGTFWRFPRGFSPANPNGIRPISTYLKVIADFCRWGDRIVFGCDDQTKDAFLGKRGLKKDAPRCTRSQSNLWFVEPEKLKTFGPPSGEGYVWLNEDVKAGDVSDPYLHAGYESMRFSFTRADGTPVKHELVHEGDWVRVKCLEDAKGATARFRYGPAPCKTPPLDTAKPFIEVTDDNGKVWRFPNVNGDMNVVCREIATERDLLYVGGVWYEAPAENAGGFAALRPIALADAPVKSLRGERGLMYLNEKPMVIDDLWTNGTASAAYWLWESCQVQTRSVYDAELYSQVRTEDLTDANRATYVADAKAAGVDVVLLSISDFFEEEARRQEILGKLAAEIKHFEAAGFAVGVWINCFGWGNEREFFKGCTKITNLQGKPQGGAVCPLEPKLRRALLDNVRDIARVGAKFILMDDDYVQSARSLVGCSCPNHLARVAAKCGRQRVTCADVKAAFTGKPNALRTAYLDVTGEVAMELARELRRAVDEVNPAVGMGLCASYTHWDVEGCDLLELVGAFAGKGRKVLRISGAPYWPNAKLPDTGLADVIEFVRMQSAWTRGLDMTVFDENDPYPRKVARVPPWRCELYDKAIIADGHLGRHKYMLCYGADRAEPGYLEAHLADMPDDPKLRRIFAGTAPYGVKVDCPRHRLRTAELPTPFVGEAQIAARYSQPAEAFALRRKGIPTRFDGPTSSDEPLAVTVRAPTPDVYQIVHCDRSKGEYAVLLENMGDSPADVTIVTKGKARVLSSLRGEFAVVSDGLALAALPPHAYAAVRFSLAAER